MQIRVLATLILSITLLMSISGCVVLSNPTSKNGYIIAENVGGSIGGQTLVYSYPLLMKLDSKGTIVWMKNLEAGSEVTMVKTTNDGNFLAIGRTFIVEGKHGIFLAKLDNSGNMLWSNTYESKNLERANNIQEAKDGGYIVIGEVEQFNGQSWQILLEKIDSKGNIEWSKVFVKGAGSVVKQVDDGGYIVAGSTTPNYTSLWIAEVDSNGTLEWEKTLDSSKYVRCYDLFQTQDGGYSIIGSSDRYSPLVWLIHLDKDGNINWDKKYSYPSSDKMGNSNPADSPYSVGSNQDEDLIIITLNGRILKMSLNGELVWENIASGARNLNSNEKIFPSPVEQIPGGYLIALSKIGYKLPVSPGVMSREVYHKLIFTKFNLDGEKDWEKTLDLPVDEQP